MQIEDGDDIAGMGGLMGTAMYSRGFAGAVIGGGVRDLPQLMRINFPVYSTGVVPSTAVGHYRFDAMNVPIVCDGIDVAPSDIVVADADGVVVVPRAKAVDVLLLAQSLDKEHSTYPFIEKFHSNRRGGEAVRADLTRFRPRGRAVIAWLAARPDAAGEPGAPPAGSSRSRMQGR